MTRILKQTFFRSEFLSPRAVLGVISRSPKFNGSVYTVISQSYPEKSFLERKTNNTYELIISKNEQDLSHETYS